MKDIGKNKCSPVLNPVHSENYALAIIQSFRNVCPYPPYTRRYIPETVIVKLIRFVKVMKTT